MGVQLENPHGLDAQAAHYQASRVVGIAGVEQLVEGPIGGEPRERVVAAVDGLYPGARVQYSHTWWVSRRLCPTVVTL